MLTHAIRFVLISRESKFSSKSAKVRKSNEDRRKALKSNNIRSEKTRLDVRESFLQEDCFSINADVGGN